MGDAMGDAVPELAVPELGRIHWVEDIREVWKHEASGFTPWLLANGDDLASALGLEIELEQTERSVGSFSLDLIGRDLTHDCRLIVENQIEPSDHGHLGQLLTYTAGTDAPTIVWIARSFRDEHRNALDWLNANTGEETRFFGVVVKALRVDRSLPAPFFEVVSKPNDWQKAVKAATSAQESAQAEAYRAFWAPVRESIETTRPELFEGRSVPRSIWLGINSPVPKTSISGEIGAGELRIRVEIDSGDRAENLKILGELEAHRAALEARLGELDFNSGVQRCAIFRRRPWTGKLIDQPERYDEAREWFRASLLEFLDAFETLPAGPPGEASSTST